MITLEAQSECYQAFDADARVLAETLGLNLWTDQFGNTAAFIRIQDIDIYARKLEEKSINFQIR